MAGEEETVVAGSEGADGEAQIGHIPIVDLCGPSTASRGTEARGALIVGPYVCPHRCGEPCPCKKPNVLLSERAASEHHVKAEDCFVVGDSPDDVRAARLLEAHGCLVRTGWASDPRVVEKALRGASIVVDSFGQAVDWILSLER